MTSLPPEPLADDEVHVWWLRAADAAPDLHAAALAWMSPDERVRHDRYAFERSRELYRLTRWLVRATLSRYAAVAPASWRFVTNAHGRPDVEAPAPHRDLRFNATNTAGLVALAVARGREVGVDAEDTSRPGPTVEVADRFFAPAEVTALRALPTPAARRERFFAYWTLKEAYLKARGLGLSLPLDAFAFTLEEAGPRIAFDPRIADVPESWHFERHRPTPQHRLALAVRASGSPPQVTVREALSG